MRTHRLFTILLILLLGWLMAVHNLGLESLWYDEWITWDFSRQGPVGLTLATAEDVHPPLYYVWVWVWMVFTGSQDVFVMRLSSGIPALLAIALTYRAGSRWFNSRWVGLGAAAFLATSGVYIYYARELRMYTFVVLLAVWSWLLLWRFVTGRDRHPWYYALSVILMAYTYYFTAFMVAMQALVVLLHHREKLWRLLWAYAGVGLALLPWIPVFIHQLQLEGERAGQAGAIGKFAATDPTNAQTISTFMATYTAGQGALVLLLTGLALVLAASRPPAFRRGVVSVALWLFGTMGLFFGINLFIPVYNLRYVLMVIPALALLVGTITLTFERPARLAFIALVAAGGVLFHAHAFLPPKLAHGELLPMIAERYQPGDRIWYNLTDGALGSSLDLEARYYLEVVVPQLDTDWFIWDAPRDFALVQANPRVWDVRPYWIPTPPEAESALLNGRELVSEEILRIYSIRLYAAPPGTAVTTFDERLAVQVSPLSHTNYAAGETVRVVTWWQALQALPLDYSYGLTLRDTAGQVMLGQDDGLLLKGRTTSQWTPGAEFTPLLLELALPADLPPGDYDLGLVVYFWQEPQPLALDSGGDFLQLGRITVG